MHHGRGRALGKRMRDGMIAGIMIAVAFASPLVLRGGWFIWGLPIVVMIMFTVVDVTDMKRTNRDKRWLMRSSIVNALVIGAVHGLVLLTVGAA